MKAKLLMIGGKENWIMMDGNEVVTVTLSEEGMRVSRTGENSKGKTVHHVSDAKWSDLLPKAEGQLELFKS